MYDIIIVRNGEISIKKRNKADFENALVKNIKYRLYKNKEVKIQKENGRVEISLANADAFEIIKKIDDEIIYLKSALKTYLFFSSFISYLSSLFFKFSILIKNKGL